MIYNYIRKRSNQTNGIECSFTCKFHFNWSHDSHRLSVLSLRARSVEIELDGTLRKVLLRLSTLRNAKSPCQPFRHSLKQTFSDPSLHCVV